MVNDLNTALIVRPFHGCVIRHAWHMIKALCHQRQLHRSHSGHYGIDVTVFDDTMLLSYAMHGGLHNHGMDALSERYLNHSPIAIKTLIGSGKSAITFDKVKIEDAVSYAAA